MLIHDPYYDVKGVSNSSLKHINPLEEGSPAKFKEHWDGLAPSLRTSSLEFGNLLHLAVLEPHLCNYEIDNTNTPDKIRDILKDMYQSLQTSNDLAAAITGDNEAIGPLEDHVYAVIEACNRQAYGRTWKEETRINKVMSQGAAYWDLLRNSDKFIITRDQFDLMERCMHSLRNTNHDITELLFSDQDNAFGSFHNELEVHWTDDQYCFPLKGKIDRLWLDHDNKKFRIIDLKTTSKTLGMFHESFAKYRYARQIAYYEMAAKQWLKQNTNQTYAPLEHCICAVETKGKNRAGLFYVSEHTQWDGQREAENLLERLNYHFTHDSWVQDMESENNIKIYL
jgi:hypothetical protein